MRRFARLTHVVAFLCVVSLATAPGAPLSAYAPRQIAGVYAPTVATAAPMTLTVTAADNGGTVQVGAGGDVLLELRGNPSTGYRWQVITNDDSILLPLGEWFVPDTDLDGASGLEKFSFHVMAPGAASLRLVYSRPWETGTPPFQTFAVTVEAVDQAAPTAPVTVGSADVGKMIALLPGQLLHVALEGDSTGAWKFMKGDPMFVQQLGNWVVTPLGAGWDPSDGQVWWVTAHNPAVLRVLPASDAVLAPATGAVVAARHFLFQAVAAGQSDLAIGLFAPGIPTPVQTFTATTAVDWAQHQYLPTVARQ